jgi:hypothetical protein
VIAFGQSNGTMGRPFGSSAIRLSDSVPQTGTIDIIITSLQVKNTPVMPEQPESSSLFSRICKLVHVSMPGCEY